MQRKRGVWNDATGQSIISEEDVDRGKDGSA